MTLAQRACEVTGFKVPAYLDTLAVAYAAVGRFMEAVAVAQRAIELARSSGQAQLAKEIDARLALYQAGRPYRLDQDHVRSESPDTTLKSTP